MRSFINTACAVALAIGLAPMQAQAITVTFDLPYSYPGSYIESGVTVSQSGGLILADNNADSSMDIFNAVNQSQPITFTFGALSTLDALDIVGLMGVADAHMQSNLGGSFHVLGMGTFLLNSLPAAQQTLWTGISSFTWTQLGGAMMLDNVVFALCATGPCAPPAQNPVANPEPASVVLMGSGLAGLAAWRLRRQRAVSSQN